MGTFFSSIGSGLIVAIIVAIFGIGSITVHVIHGSTVGSPKKWKWVILTAWAMLLGGALLVGSHNGQLNNIATSDIYALLGFNLMGFSIPVWIIGKIGEWLNRP